jgi:hypothetical protein
MGLAMIALCLVVLAMPAAPAVEEHPLRVSRAK